MPHMNTFTRLTSLCALVAALLALAQMAQAQRQDRPDGSIIYIVQAGDTVDGIAFAFGVTRAEIMALNNMTDPRLIQIGQELIIRPAGAVTPTADPALAPPAVVPSPSSAPINPPALPPAPVLSPEQPAFDPRTVDAAVCLELFEDANQNRIRDAGEPALAGGSLRVEAGGVEAAAWTTDGEQALYCVNPLPAGGYTASASAPTGYGLTGTSSMSIQAEPGAQIRIAFGAARGAVIQPPPAADLSGIVEDAPASIPQQAPPTNPVGDNLAWIAFALAGIVLLGGLSMAWLTRGRRG